ncbi:MAG TPA: divalent-cation tolerance protein CutA [Syntrophales bacterium]|jgi:periplasmic divalent cation tolerance protein|nr:divalent-cation tolerance protein CutA [Syntrophales bacterium]HON23700.1 divalent-cation tolerance protein CutA [Syntrophales bacterium]HOU77277.1 divalent-cation tolerance protein CutA [Syntrophales bacterium]HPC32707.1 divalent-cation tolerance protein CutA [Syntrophales bacterium]HQG34232.1 divalent-cation tolerance protein CutA [Syntrophales bacterium]
MTEFIQIVTTIDTEAGAGRIARSLVENSLAACVQVVGPITSTYRWEGKVETAREWQCLIKARAEAFPRIAALLREMHPYDTPEIVALPICDGSEAYLAWMDDVLPGEKRL